MNEFEKWWERSTHPEDLAHNRITKSKAERAYLAGAAAMREKAAGVADNEANGFRNTRIAAAIRKIEVSDVVYIRRKHYLGRIAHFNSLSSIKEKAGGEGGVTDKIEDTKMSIDEMLNKGIAYDKVLKEAGFRRNGDGIKPWSLRYTNENGKHIDIRSSEWTYDNETVGNDPESLKTFLDKV